MDYTEREDAIALTRLVQDIEKAGEDAPCPREGCGGSLFFTPAYPAEWETNTPAWRGGVNCDCCDYANELEPEEQGE